MVPNCATHHILWSQDRFSWEMWHDNGRKEDLKVGALFIGKYENSGCYLHTPSADVVKLCKWALCINRLAHALNLKLRREKNIKNKIAIVFMDVL